MNSENIQPKSKVMAFFLSALPGAGHMYLGLLKQGTQIMLLFFSFIFIASFLDFDMLGVFIPVIWFYSLFDCLKKVSLPVLPEDTDMPFIKWLMKDMDIMPAPTRARYLGYGLIFIGTYLLFEKTILPNIEDMLSYKARTLIRTSLVSLLLIAGGFKLLMASKNNIAKRRLEE